MREQAESSAKARMHAGVVREQRARMQQAGAEASHGSAGEMRAGDAELRGRPCEAMRDHARACVRQRAG